MGGVQGCIRREGAEEAAIRQAVGGGCQSSWGRLLSVTDASETGTCRQGLGIGWAPWRGGGAPNQNMRAEIKNTHLFWYMGAEQC